MARRHPPKPGTLVTTFGDRPPAELLELSVGPGERWLVRARLHVSEWSVEYTIIEQQGQPVVVDLHFAPFSEPPVGGLTARTVRSVSFTHMIEIARVLVRRAGVDDDTGTVARFESWIEKKPLRRQPGRRKRPDLDFARISAAYVEAVRRGSRSPVADVAKAMKEDRNFVRDMLNVARRDDRGLLTSPPPGRAGGELTPKAKALLAEVERPKMPRRRRTPRGATTGGKS